jgi:alkaline phosphatase/alkaline phosphatase D
MGIMSGSVTDSSALIQVRLTEGDKLVDGDLRGAWGVVEFDLAPTAGVQVMIAHALPQRDFIARLSLKNLVPHTNYTCKTRIGLTRDTLRPGPTVEFKTLPGSSVAEPVRFAVVTGMNYAKFHGDERINRVRSLVKNNTKLPQPYSGPDKHLGYPALATILKMQPDFFVGTGDNIYYDTPDDPRAESISEMRQKWHEQFIQPRFQDLFAKVPTFWIVDDHDYRVDDGDNSGDFLPLPETARRILLEQLPYAAFEEPAAKTHRTHRVSKDLQIWFPENRFYRSPNAWPDGPEKTIWGEDQKKWLKESLASSDASFKLLISPTPMVGPDDLRKTDNHCDLGGFQHERDEFFDFLNENGLNEQNFFIVCGDRHWQYHAVDSSGVEEFSCGALVDANSRLGRMPGDPAGTDPEGLIRHLHKQTQRSGGFLMISCTPASGEHHARLSFDFHDEHGKLLYRTIKQ